MTKFIKKLCLILALIVIPMGFVACKDNDANDSTTPETPASTPEVTFSITKDVANQLIVDSVAVFEDAIDDINTSGILSSGLNVGTTLTTPDLFDHVYNAKLFKEECVNKTVEINSIYAFVLGGEQKFNYFNVYNEDDSALYIDYVNRAGFNYQFIGYKYVLSNNVIKRLEINYFEKESNSLNYALFGNLYLDFENSCFEVYSGKVFGHTDNSIKTKFNSTDIGSVNGWAYSYYEKYEFGSNPSYTCNYVSGDCAQEVVDKIDVLDVPKGLETYDSYQLLQESDFGTKLNKTTNYIGNINNNFDAMYVYRDNKFEKSI